MTPLFVSSGHILADRRYQWAADLAGRGDLRDAADLLAQVVDQVPRFAAAWFALGEIRERLGEREAAIAAFIRARDSDAEDRHGAALHLARLGAAGSAPVTNAGYVRMLFDQQAEGFDGVLRERLGYRGPELLLAAVEGMCAASGRRMHFGTMLDLGCGTGLAGQAFRPHVNWLRGVDLSPGMVARARAKGIYDVLDIANIEPFLSGQIAAHAACDLVTAADVFVYFPDLAPVARAVAALLTPDGMFAFTVETHAGEGARIGETLRYAHSAALVRAAAEAAGLTLLQVSEVTLRTEKGAPVMGLVVVAGRQEASTGP